MMSPKVRSDIKQNLYYANAAWMLADGNPPIITVLHINN